MSTHPVDPITREVVRNRLEAILREMEAIIYRTARSSVVYSGGDFTCAIFDGRPELLATGVGSLNHVMPVIWQIRKALGRFGSDVAPGDLFVGNDPYDGGTHLNDVLIFMPVFYRGERVGFTGSRVHYHDVGGMVPGSISGSSREIYQEGLRIPLIRLGRRDQLDSNVVDLILRNVRVPHETFGDMTAQVASCRRGAERIIQMLEHYGKDVVLTIWRSILELSEQRIRRLLRDLPDTSVSHEAYLDNDGVQTEHRRIRVRVTKKKDEICVDYSGTSPQSQGPVNITEALANGFAFIGVKAALDPSGRIDGGVFRAITVIAPEGTMVNARPPAAAAGTGEVGQAAIVPMVALSKLLPDRVSVEDSASANHANFGGTDRRSAEHQRFVYYDYPPKGGGARSRKDGVDATRDIRLGTMNTQSLEVLEQCFPVHFVRYALRRDSGGPGKFRGGLGVVREFQALTEGIFSMLSEHSIMPLSGLFGGHPGALARWEMVRNGEVRFISPEFRSKVTAHPIIAGDTIRIATQGGSGWGDPLERDPRQVLDDVGDGKVSVEQARAVYGVSIDPTAFTVYDAATQGERTMLASQRLFVSVRGGGEPAYQEGVRLGWIAPSLLAAASVKEGDLTEAFASRRPNPLRLRVQIEPTLPSDTLLLDVQAMEDLEVEEGDQVLWRRVRA